MKPISRPVSNGCPYHPFRAGFTLLEILIVVTIIGLLAVLAMPSFVKSRAATQRGTCIENLNTLESAKQMWGLETGKSPAAVPERADLIGNELYIKKMPACPAGGSYEFNSLATNATCTQAGHTL